MELSPMVMMAFSFIKDSLDRDRKAYEARVESSRENGKKGGRPKNSQSEITHSVYAKPRKADNGNDNGNGNDNENEIDNVTVKERDVRKKEKEKGKPTLFSLRVFPEFRFPRLRFHRLRLFLASPPPSLRSLKKCIKLLKYSFSP